MFGAGMAILGGCVVYWGKWGWGEKKGMEVGRMKGLRISGGQWRKLAFGLVVAGPVLLYWGYDRSTETTLYELLGASGEISQVRITAHDFTPGEAVTLTEEGEIEVALAFLRSVKLRRAQWFHRLLELGIDRSAGAFGESYELILVGEDYRGWAMIAGPQSLSVVVSMGEGSSSYIDGYRVVEPIDFAPMQQFFEPVG